MYACSVFFKSPVNVLYFHNLKNKKKINTREIRCPFQRSRKTSLSPHAQECSLRKVKKGGAEPRK